MAGKERREQQQLKSREELQRVKFFHLISAIPPASWQRSEMTTVVPVRMDDAQSVFEVVYRTPMSSLRIPAAIVEFSRTQSRPVTQTAERHWSRFSITLVDEQDATLRVPVQIPDGSENVEDAETLREIRYTFERLEEFHRQKHREKQTGFRDAVVDFLYSL